jgi:hypothetical protein
LRKIGRASLNLFLELGPIRKAMLARQDKLRVMKRESLVFETTDWMVLGEKLYSVATIVADCDKQFPRPVLKLLEARTSRKTGVGHVTSIAISLRSAIRLQQRLLSDLVGLRGLCPFRGPGGVPGARGEILAFEASLQAQNLGSSVRRQRSWGNDSTSRPK